ncbi:hypothetical protein AB0L74_21935 [Streptomyces sp. NPDC052020]|uniref:hypothetical protein n=1 Tax=Streptomyces sp. NPDC052020 TaxID=3155677 RepID=UPI00341E5CBA
MKRDFKAALARVQHDYAFYIHCQSDPETALEGYTLSPEEQATFRDPQRLAEALQQGSSMRSITIKISGTHDWINRAEAQAPKQEVVSELIAREVESIRLADNDDERRESTLRLVRLVG